MIKRPFLHRKKLFIDRDIQLPLLMYSIAMATLGVAIAAIFSVYAAKWINFGGDFILSLVFIVGCAGFCYSVMLLFGLFISNKIAGPIYRMRIHMKELCEGKNPKPLETRESDFMSKELIAQYNQLIETFKK